jgi:hypothetical protein
MQLHAISHAYDRTKTALDRIVPTMDIFCGFNASSLDPLICPARKSEQRHASGAAVSRRLHARVRRGFWYSIPSALTRSLSCPLWLLRLLEEAHYLMLEQAMAALQVHHVARVGDDHISLIWVWERLEEGKETCKIGDIVVFAVDEHRGHRHEPGMEHGHNGPHV